MSLVDIISKAGFPEGAINLLSGDPAKVSEQLFLQILLKKFQSQGQLSG